MHEMLDFVKAMSNPDRLRIIGLLSQEHGTSAEKEINTILRRFNEDTAGLRRDLVDAKMLGRESDGSRDWRVHEGAA
jgi:hypothetical protein